jgi:hypothetical protein
MSIIEKIEAFLNKYADSFKEKQKIYEVFENNKDLEELYYACMEDDRFSNTYKIVQEDRSQIGFKSDEYLTLKTPEQRIMYIVELITAERMFADHLAKDNPNIPDFIKTGYIVSAGISICKLYNELKNSQHI